MRSSSLGQRVYLRDLVPVIIALIRAADAKMFIEMIPNRIRSTMCSGSRPTGYVIESFSNGGVVLIVQLDIVCPKDQGISQATLWKLPTDFLLRLWFTGTSEVADLESLTVVLSKPGNIPRRSKTPR
jgi:hypothetical protein